MNRAALVKHVRDGWLPLTTSIVPPERRFFLWKELPEPEPSDTPLMQKLQSAMKRSLEGVDNVGVWASGGIDSSIALLLAVNVLGPENVTAIHLDFGYLPDETVRAEKVTEHLGVDLIIEPMALEDHLKLVSRSVFNQRSPSDFSTQTLMAARICNRNRLGTVISGLGIDELLGGYPEHVHASSQDFSLVEERLLWRCQSFYAWIQRVQALGAGVDVKFPFLDSPLISYCRGLPRKAKCSCRETKLLLRKELKGLLPEEIIEAGRIVGTKGGFTPSIAKWWEEGLSEWVEERIREVPFRLKRECLGSKRFLKQLIGRPVNFWLSLRLATVPIFLQQYEEGSYDEEPLWNQRARQLPPITISSLSTAAI